MIRSSFHKSNICRQVFTNLKSVDKFNFIVSDSNHFLTVTCMVAKFANQIRCLRQSFPLCMSVRYYCGTLEDSLHIVEYFVYFLTVFHIFLEGLYFAFIFLVRSYIFCMCYCFAWLTSYVLTHFMY